MQHIKTLRRSLGAAAATGLLAVQQAYAAVPAEATEALDTAGTDVGTIGWAVFAVIIAAMAFKYMRRAL
ncbi:MULTISPECIES: major capsid protein [Stutzerimonas stutzeri subgroup]|uniref:major capsid protein n=1 Tax=Stutzerimonas stutzeri subgroup TaxID=578833 RepID=UPI00066A314B|nr:MULTISPECIES: major capsid protein [Stutzerimonas stutzeri subgroup]MBS9724634.1 phage coat protein [Stutzerimonas stutzeri]MCQ4236451.1 phage coat protein [Stutzerimonas stutzeri]MDH0212772.1 phage coat protein [Stutzerimonas stutzeri]MDH0260695.1 phage coat protein [Stutzerimonas stutzeri]MDH0503189.1 phage coat protein [Stutzerimonas stutzeri]